jgi:hypothetical protein
MILSKKQAKAVWISETLDLKEIMLNSEGYYKITSPKKADLFLWVLYVFAFIWVAHTIMFYIHNFMN